MLNQFDCPLRQSSSHLIRDDVLEPREAEHGSDVAIGGHHPMDLVDHIVQAGVVVLQLLASGYVPKSIQEGHV